VKFDGPAGQLLERGDLARAVFLGENGHQPKRRRKASR